MKNAPFFELLNKNNFILAFKKFYIYLRRLKVYTSRIKQIMINYKKTDSNQVQYID